MDCCPWCQHENPADAAFCDECGARLEAACPSCGEPNRPGAKFCRMCGSVVVQAAGAGQGSPTTFGAPETYTPRHLAEKILTSKAALEGERKQVTVLFADLKGSMELLADRDPEEARKLLDPVLERMMEAVHRYEGTVNQVMGDGIMALFGAPLAHEDHAVRACYAALRMQESVRKYAEEVGNSQAAGVRIRVGLNSGEVVVRAIGSDLHMDYTAVGETTHVASRMEQAATPGTILASAATANLASAYVAMRPLDSMTIKGLGRALLVYEIVGRGRARSRFHAVAERGLGAFIGRGGEQSLLTRAIELARGGQGQIVAVVGEPGIGKSRLVWEFLHSRHVEGCRVLDAVTDPFGRNAPYFPVVQLLKDYFDLGERADEAGIRDKIEHDFAARHPALVETMPALLALLDVAPGDPGWPTLAPAERHRRTLDALEQLVLEESRRQPLILVVEDLHWVDTETLAWLDALADALSSRPLLLLVTYRPEHQHGWDAKANYSRLRLEPLAGANADELLQSLLGDDTRLVPVKQLLNERTQGNPFFLEESVRSLVETGILAGEPGSYRLVGPADAIRMPATVQTILTARIDRLDREDKRVLQAAAVVGRRVPFAILRDLVDDDDETLHQRLARLQAADFLYRTQLFPEPEYTFKHALTQDAAYGELVRERRRDLHARIATAIEHRYADRLVEHVEALAHHAVQGGLWEKAVTFLRRAAEKASARPAHREAVARYKETLAALEHLPRTNETLEQGVDVHLALGSELVLLDEFGQLLTHLREAEALARASGDRHRLAMVASYIAHWHFVQGSGYERTIEWGEEALVLAEDTDDAGLRAVTCMYLGYAWLGLGDYRQAARLMRSNIERLSGDLVRVHWGTAVLPSAISREVLARCLAELGEFDEGLAHARAAIGIAEAHHPATLGQVSYGLGYVHLRRGEADSAIAALERGLSSARQWNTSLLVPYLASALGEAYLMVGRLAEALPLLEEGAVSERVARSLRLARLGEGYLRAGRLDAAWNTAERALHSAREAKERGYEAWTLSLLGALTAGREPSDVAAGEQHYRQAMAIATELSMRPLVARCHLGLGVLYRRAARDPEAREHLSQATAVFQEMKMRYWLDKARDELLAL
jgi:class 3 adenylate cyclase/tetratricopeptide (TPR) repeat protein